MQQNSMVVRWGARYIAEKLEVFVNLNRFFFHLQAVEVPSCLVYLESQIHVVLKRGLDVGKKLLKMMTIHRQLLGKFFLSKGSSHLLVNNLGHVSYFFIERVMLNTMYVKRTCT